ncbi:hypothetical protein [Streptomyces nanshensis]|uniref:Uncharacterized protein n=1 Tax=Streptomyces nanshensis TaxID=518642 RepID=A0A1E7LAE1_9ACTN|nr:hypothetical protein [Streptomyces nanshensis]OEV13205.1 hypothetical protein AN218_04625 [Streptomyces nanshensis]
MEAKTEAAESERECESCGRGQVVIAQYGISLAALGLSSRFCTNCVAAELAALGLAVPKAAGDEPAAEAL